MESFEDNSILVAVAWLDIAAPVHNNLAAAAVGKGLVEKVEHGLHALESVTEEFQSTGLGTKGFENVA